MRTLAATALVLAGQIVSLAQAKEIGPLLKTLATVGPGNSSQREAAAAWRKLSQADAQQLPMLLDSLDNASPLAANWIRSAGDAIVERQLRQGAKLPTADIEAFVRDTAHAPRARRLAYEWLVQVDPAAPDRLLPGLLDDPSTELRRDAVARLIAQAEGFGKSRDVAKAKAVYQQAISAAVDADQIRHLADRLQRLGEKVDLARAMGFVVRWKLVGPFDNVGGGGFDRVEGPERAIDLAASYPGKHGDVRWIDFTSSDAMGQVDLNRALDTEKGVTAYATSDFFAKELQAVEVRIATQSAVKLWLNGSLVDQHHVYHGGLLLDQYVCRVTLQPGQNVLLVKACQNEQKQEWAHPWGFQLRICDPRGRPVLSTDR